jgi:hypothetical protein
MSFPLWILRLGTRKTCRLSGISSHAALTQVTPLQRDYMLSGREVHCRSVQCFIDETPRICVPASDAVDGRLGGGIEEILSLRSGKSVQMQNSS